MSTRITVVEKDDADRLPLTRVDSKSTEFTDVGEAIAYLQTLQGPAVPVPQPVPDYVPPPADSSSVVLFTADSPQPIRSDLFGMTVLHAGQSYYSKLNTPDPGGQRLPIHFSRQFLHWSLVEQTPGVYDFARSGSGQNMLGRAQWFKMFGIPWVGVVNPGHHPNFYPGYKGGPLNDPAPYAAYIAKVIETFAPLGLVALELANEPESGSWWGTLGAAPVASPQIRQSARELAPWARHAKAAIRSTGLPIELWGPACQSMATADPGSGLAAVFCDPGVKPYFATFGKCFTDGDDGAGGMGIDHIDRFSWHGYPSPLTDPTLLIAHHNKARAWIAKVGRGSMPMVVSEHGVVSTAGKPLWKTLTDKQRERWVLNAYGCAAALDTRVIFYAWDETDMGIYGAGGPVPNEAAITRKVNALLAKFAVPGMRVFEVRSGATDGQLQLLLGTTRENALPYALD